MKRTILLLLVIAGFSLGLSAQSTYKTDPYHSSVNFKIKHLAISFVKGKFDKFEGTLTGNPSDPTTAKVSFTVETPSINTGVEARDNHLRSADFFEVEKYPTMSFKSTSVEMIDDKHFKLNGVLTIKDVSKPTTFMVTYGGLVKGEDGTNTVGFVAENTINRLDYNVSYDATSGMIGKKVDITLYLEFKGK